MTSIREPEAISGWLATTARRESWRVLHDARRERPIVDERQFDVATHQWFGEEPEQHALSVELQRTVQRCVEQLPERCRLLLRILMKDPPPSYEEVSATLHMPIGSIGPVRGRCLQSARQSLRRMGWQR
jgi:DNA-directed RNA polymerase specialized sigma24 family protein